MTREEFDRWLDRYCTLFPESGEWIMRIPDGRRQEMLKAWADLLEDVDYRDCRAVTELMFGGDDPTYPPLGVMFGDRERTPSHVKKLARQLRYERQAREHKRAEEKRLRDDRLIQGRTRYKHSMGELFRSLMAWTDEGVPREEANRRMREMADKLPERGERGYQAADGYDEMLPTMDGYYDGS